MPEVRRVRRVRRACRAGAGEAAKADARFEQVTRVGADGRYLAPSSPGLP